MADKFKSCAVDGCKRNSDRSAQGRAGFCKAHYRKKMVYGDPVGGRQPPPDICSVDGCGGFGSALGYCTKHYQRFKKYGDPTIVTSKASPARDWLISNASHQGDDCLKWPFHTMGNGYGQVNLRGSVMVASRAMCIVAHGDPPSSDYEAAHSCGKGNEGCVNPRHLRWATASENQLERAVHGTSNAGERHWTKRRARS